MENDSFAVIPSLGSLVEGWLLCVPKRDMLRFSELTAAERHSLAEMEDTVESFLSSEYGSYVVFEHAPSKLGSSIGCSTDHAHRHYVPLSRLGTALISDDRLKDWRPLDRVKSLSSQIGSKCEYYYIRQGVQEYVLLEPPDEAQYFRKLIASRLGKECEWNWRVHPQLENIRSTAFKFVGWGDGR